MDEYRQNLNLNCATSTATSRIRELTSMSDAAEAKLMSQAHMRWMVATLQSEGGKCTYEKLVEVGEEHHCDTVGALLKVSRETLSH